MSKLNQKFQSASQNIKAPAKMVKYELICESVSQPSKRKLKRQSMSQNVKVRAEMSKNNPNSLSQNVKLLKFKYKFSVWLFWRWRMEPQYIDHLLFFSVELFQPIKHTKLTLTLNPILNLTLNPFLTLALNPILTLTLNMTQ